MNVKLLIPNFFLSLNAGLLVHNMLKWRRNLNFGPFLDFQFI